MSSQLLRPEPQEADVLTRGVIGMRGGDVAINNSGVLTSEPAISRCIGPLEETLTTWTKRMERLGGNMTPATVTLYQCIPFQQD